MHDDGGRQLWLPQGGRGRRSLHDDGVVDFEVLSAQYDGRVAAHGLGGERGLQEGSAQSPNWQGAGLHAEVQVGRFARRRRQTGSAPVRSPRCPRWPMVSRPC